MEQFAVMYQIGTCRPGVEETFASLEDAKTFAQILARKNKDWHYYVLQVVEAI